MSHTHIAGSDAPELPHLQLGFMPLSDCAPLVAAKWLDLGRPYGLNLTLRRQPSWAAIRDKLLSGELHAAQALYGLVYGVQLGLGGPQADMAILLNLNQNGQAISLSNSLAAEVQRCGSLQAALADRPAAAHFAHTFPTGTHAMWLYYWLAAQGLHPLRDVRSMALPPPLMPAALAAAELDGFCAGEPWHAVVAADGSGRTLVGSGEIWPDHPEKVLACRADFIRRYPNTARALTATLLAACRWLDDPEQRRSIAVELAQPAYLNLPSSVIAPRMLGDHGRTPLSAATRPLRFHGGGEVNFPYLSDGLWFLSQYRRWGMLPEAVDMQAVAAKVNQLALYREAADSLGIAIPASPLRRSILIDGIAWDGSDPAGYAAQFPIQA
ncbi:ABC transporter substrate-binding protein [Chitinimonas arctica]|uniref:ABC transporter substrate-binding protein n=1 Tax=Chitinimonas arctica TaxID=2594795 RepID=A0A516SLE4_9NEIS|nr:CmpA/NrtA family ABC transporter substrate-binding protein [Chitinimonas arctica]QDQ28955.1 ABC transporter substrate-binding protein [Chitinimonas arctica]